jgi:hypothetical protein
VERVHYDPLFEEKRKKLVEEQLRRLASEEITFTVEAKKDLVDEDIRRSYERMLDSIRDSLERLEERHRFLSSEVQDSLMEIEEYLEKLALEFRVPHIPDEGYLKSVSVLIGKIMKEILKLKENGFWTDW